MHHNLQPQIQVSNPSFVM